MTDSITSSGGIIGMFDPANYLKVDLIVAQTTAAFQAGAVWDALIASYTVTGSFGEFVTRRLLTVAKFFSMRI